MKERNNQPFLLGIKTGDGEDYFDFPLSDYDGVDRRQFAEFRVDLLRFQQRLFRFHVLVKTSARTTVSVIRDQERLQYPDLGEGE